MDQLFHVGFCLLKEVSDNLFSDCKVILVCGIKPQMNKNPSLVNTIKTAGALKGQESGQLLLKCVCRKKPTLIKYIYNST